MCMNPFSSIPLPSDGVVHTMTPASATTGGVRYHAREDLPPLDLSTSAVVAYWSNRGAMDTMSNISTQETWVADKWEDDLRMLGAQLPDNNAASIRRTLEDFALFLVEKNHDPDFTEQITQSALEVLDLLGRISISRKVRIINWFCEIDAMIFTKIWNTASKSSMEWMPSGDIKDASSEDLEKYMKAQSGYLFLSRLKELARKRLNSQVFTIDAANSISMALAGDQQ